MEDNGYSISVLEHKNFISWKNIALIYKNNFKILLRTWENNFKMLLRSWENGKTMLGCNITHYSIYYFIY